MKGPTLHTRYATRTFYVGAVLLVAVVGGATALARRADVPTEETVAEVLRQGIVASQNSFTTPGAAALGTSLAVGHHDETPELLVDDPPAEALELQAATGARELARYWTGPALAKQIETQQRWIGAQRPTAATRDPDFRPLGGGVTDLRITAMDATDDGVSVRAEVVMWAAMAQIDRDGEGATVDKPSNTLDARARLVKRDDTWLIDEYDWTFAPGGGP